MYISTCTNEAHSLAPLQDIIPRQNYTLTSSSYKRKVIGTKCLLLHVTTFINTLCRKRLVDEETKQME